VPDVCCSLKGSALRVKRGRLCRMLDPSMIDSTGRTACRIRKSFLNDISMCDLARSGFASVLFLLTFHGTVHAAPAPPVLPAQHVITCPSETQKIDEQKFVPIGGIEQWITVSGTGCKNPVVLILHGGPGNTMSPYANNIYAAWLKEFTVVQWDQRGAGRTFGRNPGAAESELTIDRMTKDGVELAAYLARVMNTQKIILVGGSWGSVLGVHMAKSRPDLFHAYVGSGQLVSDRENQDDSVRSVLALARAAGDTKRYRQSRRSAYRRGRTPATLESCAVPR
jgi:pimeloyl-ACP methyl ester carboxylesterase